MVIIVASFFCVHGFHVIGRQILKILQCMWRFCISMMSILNRFGTGLYVWYRGWYRPILDVITLFAGKSLLSKIIDIINPSIRVDVDPLLLHCWMHLKDFFKVGQVVKCLWRACSDIEVPALPDTRYLSNLTIYPIKKLNRCFRLSDTTGSTNKR